MAKKPKKNEERVDFNSLDNKSKEKILDKAFDVLDKFSVDAMTLDKAQSNIESYEDTGCYILNALLSGDLKGGFPSGRLSVMSAESSTGKSYIALQTAALAQRKGKRVVIFDSENAIDAGFATALGLDLSKVKHVPVDSIEMCKSAMYALLKHIIDNNLKEQFLIIIDSLGAMMSETDFKRAADDSDAVDMGTKARAMKALITLSMNMSAKSKTTIIMTNHVYDDPSARFVTVEKPMPGGKVVKYLGTTWVQLSKKLVKEDNELNINDTAALGSLDNTGILIRGVSIKNRVCKPYNEASFYISWTKGLSKYYGLFDLAKDLDLIVAKGAGRWYRTDTDEYIGTRHDIPENAKFWESFLPVLQKAIDDNWRYNTHEISSIEIQDDEALAEALADIDC